MIVPYSTEVVLKRWPISNLVFIALSTLFYAAVLFGDGEVIENMVAAMILLDWNPIGLFGHMFLHAGFIHLAFNMLYLWVFGNAVCEKVGSWLFALVFLLAGLSSAIVHNIFDGHPAVGASGAINGIIGFYLVLHPINKVNCFYWLFFRAGTFDITGFWLILFWFIVDAWRAFFGAEDGIAYWAHVGGFVSGVLMGVVFLKTGLAKMADYDNPTLLDYFSGKKRKQGLAYERQSFSRVRHRQPGESPAAKPSVPSWIPRAQPKPEPKPAPVPSDPSDLQIECPHCSKPLTIPAWMVGRSFQCHHCQGEIELEAE